jgi:hypothetical protein
MPALIVIALLLLASVAHAHPLDVTSMPALREYFVLGVEHILTGYDHLLFVAGLVIATLKLRELVWTISAFTVAHSLTLGLGMLGLVTPSGTAVELIIALSIAYVGYENLRTPVASRARVWLVMAFGLAHGFGFAGAIAEVGLPAQGELAALALFNLGVEVGQLAVVTALWPLLSLARRQPKVELAVSRAVNVALIVAGLGWTLERSVAEPEEAPAAHAALEPNVMLSAQAMSAEPNRDLTAAEITPWMRSVCHALHTLPRERRAACSNEKPGATVAPACEKTLAASVARRALKIDSAGAERCVAAMRTRYEGCAWLGARVMEPEPACQSFLAGAIADGSSCGSSLECGAGSHCHGAGPFDRGVCGPPRQDGARCELAADPLASYITAPETMHPECRGRCVRGRCAESTGS